MTTTHQIRQHARAYEWYEIKHRIYTLRKLRWGLWQLVDNEHRIIAEGRRRDCLDAMHALRRPM